MFRFILTDNISGATQTLGRDPSGWREIRVSLSRSERFHGVFDSFTAPIKFWCNAGKELIDIAYQADGICADVTISIDFSCGGWIRILNGRLNFETYRRDKVFTQVEVEEDSIASVLRSREDVDVDLAQLESIDGTALNAYNFAEYDLNLHSQAVLIESALAQPQFPVIYSDTIAFVVSQGEHVGIQHPYPVAKADLKSINDNPNFAAKDTILNPDLLDQMADFFILQDINVPVPASITVSFDFSGTFRDRNAGANTRISSGGFSLVLRKSDGKHSDFDFVNVLGNIPGYSTGAVTYTDTFNFAGSFTINNFQANDRLFLNWNTSGTGYVVTTGGSPQNVDFEFEYDTAEITLTFDDPGADSDCKAWAIHEAWSRLSEIITDQATGAFESEYFGRTDSQPLSYADNGCGSFLAVTNGRRIRQQDFKSRGREVSTSLKDMFDACNSVWNIGLTVKDRTTVKVEDKAFFYQNVQLLDLGSVKDVKMSFERSRVFNEFEGGYRKWEIEQAAGADEFNSSAWQFTNKIKRVKSEVMAVSPYIAGGYAIEITRRLRFDIEKDWRYDDDMFFICLNRSVDGSNIPTDLDVAEKDENFSVVTNIFDPATTYNLRISPKRNLLRWMNVLAASLYKQAGEFWRYESAEGNHELESTMNADNCPGDYSGVLLDEDADEAWDDANIRLNSPLWEPEIYEFTHSLSPAQWLTILNNPHGFIRFADDNNVLIDGFVINIDYTIYTGQAQFRLIKKA